jgi:hypothetical protein
MKVVKYTCVYYVEGGQLHVAIIDDKFNVIIAINRDMQTNER